MLLGNNQPLLQVPQAGNNQAQPQAGNNQAQPLNGITRWHGRCITVGWIGATLFMSLVAQRLAAVYQPEFVDKIASAGRWSMLSTSGVLIQDLIGNVVIDTNIIKIYVPGSILVAIGVFLAPLGTPLAITGFFGSNAKFLIAFANCYERIVN